MEFGCKRRSLSAIEEMMDHYRVGVERERERDSDSPVETQPANERRDPRSKLRRFPPR